MKSQQTSILLVDDDATFLAILEQSLEKTNRHIITAQTPEDATQLMASHAFDYAVLDLNINGESGLNLLSELVDQRPHCKVLILTGYASMATAVEAMRLGALNYLCKPASAADICQALQLDNASTEPTSITTQQTVNFEPMSVKRIEWEHIQKVLIEHNGNISATAEALNMHRRTLQRKLQKRPVHK